MKPTGILFARVGLLLSLFLPSVLFAAPDDTPDFREIYELIRTNAGGLSETELNRAAVDGLLNALGPRATIVTNAAAGDDTNAAVVTKALIFDHNIGYLRITRIDDESPKTVGDTLAALGSTNQLKGAVLDLRFSDGTDYSAAAAIADLFVSKAEPLLNWGNGAVSSHAKTNAIAMPVAVLVNHNTAGAAEALAAVIRQTGTGLVLGNHTAGCALLTRDFPLKDGRRLRIGTTPVMLGDGSAMSTQGVKPDIDVTVNLEDERAYYADAFRVLAKTNASGNLSNTNDASGTNVARRARLNEAELVRERKEGASFDPDAPPRPAEPQAPVVSDPALARAIDLLKGLAVVRQK